ncbi:uncharacterized protein LOC133730761 [Rosa rugosa]|uniref:uncharacterized protein LOC133730761 n=1 Tax=Rosa rugosa TaxID=74645 RepID=UPI002B400421|nr:uncharacterized protein LOC133730761 [Rosa rugosa]
MVLVLPQDRSSAANLWKRNRKTRNKKVAVKDPDRKKRGFQHHGKVEEDAEEEDSESNTDTESKEKENDGQEDIVENRTSGNIKDEKMETEIGKNNEEKKELQRKLEGKEEELTSLINRVKHLEGIVMALTEKFESPIARPGDDNDSTPPPPPPSFPPPKPKAPQDKPTDSKHSKNTKSQGGSQGT